MKKLIMIISSVIAASMIFTACGADKEPAPAETQPTESSVSSETVTSQASEEEDILPDEEEDIEIVVPDVPEQEEQVSDNPLMPAVTKILEADEWPMMMEVTDEFIITEFFTLDPNNKNYKEYIVMQCPVSAVMSEIVIIHAEDVDAAKDDLAARRKKAIDQDAWYPHDQELAENSILGTNGDYAYFIIGDNAENAEKILNDYISSL